MQQPVVQFWTAIHGKNFSGGTLNRFQKLLHVGNILSVLVGALPAKLCRVSAYSLAHDALSGSFEWQFDGWLIPGSARKAMLFNMDSNKRSAFALVSASQAGRLERLARCLKRVVSVDSYRL